MSRCLVSIVLPTFNGERYLRQSVDSCLAQTYRNWELIIVDDASTDATPQIAAEYAEQDARIRVVHNTQNRRLPESLNVGFAYARGQYLTWTSDDNYYAPTAIEEMVEFLNQHPEKGMVCADYVAVDANGVFVEERLVGPPEHLVRYCNVGPCFLYTRSVYEKVGEYKTALFCAEDYDYWLRVLAVEDIGVLRRSLYNYRLHAASLTATRQTAIADATLEARRSACRHLAANGQYRLAAQCAICVSGEASAKYGQRESWRCLLCALVWQPQLLLLSGEGRNLLARCFVGARLGSALRVAYVRAFKPRYYGQQGLAEQSRRHT